MKRELLVVGNAATISCKLMELTVSIQTCGLKCGNWEAPNLRGVRGWKSTPLQYIPVAAVYKSDIYLQYFSAQYSNFSTVSGSLNAVLQPFYSRQRSSVKNSNI